MPKFRLQQKRIYDPVDPADGRRVLVDRLWPRGLKKTDVQIDDWLKEIAPSPGLRQWFGHQPERFLAFRDAYMRQLEEDEVHHAAVRKLMSWLQAEPVTMLYAAKDPIYNHVVVLRDYIHQQAHVDESAADGNGTR